MIRRLFVAACLVAPAALWIAAPPAPALADKDRLEPSDGPVDARVIHGTILHRVYYFSNSSLKFFVGRGASYTEAEIHTDDTTDIFDEDGDDILPKRLVAGDVVTVWRTGTHARRVERLGHTRSRNFAHHPGPTPVQLSSADSTDRVRHEMTGSFTSMTQGFWGNVVINLAVRGKNIEIFGVDATTRFAKQSGEDVDPMRIAVGTTLLVEYRVADGWPQPTARRVVVLEEP